MKSKLLYFLVFSILFCFSNCKSKKCTDYENNGPRKVKTQNGIGSSKKEIRAARKGGRMRSS